MLKKVIIKNFFSFKNAQTIELNKGINLLLGINGSGKTTFLNALRLLYEGAIEENLERLIQKNWGGYSQIANLSEDNQNEGIQVTYVFDNERLHQIFGNTPFHSDPSYRITIQPLPPANYYLKEELYVESDHSNTPFYYLDFQNGVGKLSIRDSQGQVKFVRYRENNISGQELVISQIRDPKRFWPTSIIYNAARSINIYNYFDVSETSRLRKSAEFSTSKALETDGSNITSLLNSIKNNYEEAFNKICEILNNVSGTYVGLDFQFNFSQVYLKLKERGMKRNIDLLHVSDGTLRFILMLAIFYNPERGALVGIDEPERSLHPDMTKAIADLLRYASSSSQLIIASHSPLLLNQFELDDILVFEKTTEDGSVVKRYNKDDFEEYLEDYSPGQLWLNGQIGGMRW